MEPCCGHRWHRELQAGAGPAASIAPPRGSPRGKHHAAQDARAAHPSQCPPTASRGAASPRRWDCSIPVCAALGQPRLLPVSPAVPRGTVSAVLRCAPPNTRPLRAGAVTDRRFCASGGRSRGTAAPAAAAHPRLVGAVPLGGFQVPSGGAAETAPCRKADVRGALRTGARTGNAGVLTRWVSHCNWSITEGRDVRRGFENLSCQRGCKRKEGIQMSDEFRCCCLYPEAFVTNRWGWSCGSGAACAAGNSTVVSIVRSDRAGAADRDA